MPVRDFKRDSHGRFAKLPQPSARQMAKARSRLGIKRPVVIKPLYREGARGGYAGVQRDPFTAIDSHYIYLAPAPPGPRNWALWHELAHAMQADRGEDFNPTDEQSAKEYADNPKEREAEMVANAFADIDLWEDDDE